MEASGITEVSKSLASNHNMEKVGIGLMEKLDKANMMPKTH